MIQTFLFVKLGEEVGART